MDGLEIMKMAADEAVKNINTEDGGPFGAVIVKNGVIVASAHNEVLKNKDATCHAEVQAIRLASKKLGTFDLSGCELYTSCYPCPMCLSAAIWANIKKIYYGNTAEDAANIGFRDDFIYKFIRDHERDKSVLDLQKLGREITLDAFKEFMNKADKKVY